MILIDTNLWLYATLQESAQHSKAKAWLDSCFNGSTPIAMPWSVVLAVLRISTQSRLMLKPLSPTQAVDLVDSWLQHPLVEVVQPGPTHWNVLRLLLEEAGTAGNLTADAHLAALAMEHNCTLYSADNDFRRFPGLRFRNPLS